MSGEPLDELRATMRNVLQEYLPDQKPATVKGAIVALTKEWSVTRREYPGSENNPLAEVRYGHKIVATLPFVPETDRERTERKLRHEAYFWRPSDGPPSERVTIRQLLRQDEWWRANTTPDRDDGTRSTVAVRVEDMTHDHRLALLEWLRAKARNLHDSEVIDLHGAPDEVWSVHEQEDPHEWLEECELVRALAAWTTPHAESPLTWHPAGEHPSDSRKVMARWADTDPSDSLVKACWSNSLHQWCAVEGGGELTDNLTEWRELRDDERCTFADPSLDCDHEGYEDSDCETCGSSWFSCDHGGTRDSEYCFLCEQE